MVTLYLISGDGRGAGKTTAALRLADQVWSLAGALRDDLYKVLPGYEWSNRTQEYKDNTLVKEWDNKSVRRVMTEYGQSKCKNDPQYWVRRMAYRLEGAMEFATGLTKYAVDDVRKMCELQLLKEKFGDSVLHIHVVNPDAIYEPEFENEQLAKAADYRITWQANL